MKASHAWIAGVCLCAGLPAAAAQDWIIGAADPNENVVLTSDRTVDGSVYIFNRGQLHVSGATLTVTGEVWVLDDALFELQQGTLRFPQTYAYQSGIVAAVNGQLRFTSATIDGGGRSYSVTLVGDGSAVYDQVTVTDGFSTWGLFDRATVDLTGCTNGGEFLEVAQNTLNIADTDTVLFWTVVPDGAVLDMTYPAPGTVGLWTLDPNTPGTSGIPYHARIENCTNVMWAIMARSGADVTVRDSALRGIGTWFLRANVVSIKGVANQATFTDSTFAWGDVNYHLLNTSVHAWNFYPFGQTQLTLENCVFGEVGAGEQSSVQITQSLCDGSGGYIFTGDDSTCIMFGSTNLSQTTVSDRSMLFAVESALLRPEIDVKGNAMLFLLNAQYVGEPVVHDAATLFDASVEAQRAVAGEQVALTGSARIAPGPNSPVEFVEYSLDFGSLNEPNVWTPIAGPFDQPVRKGVLAMWDTCARVPGVYPVRVSLAHNLGEPVRIASLVWLNEPADACPPGDLTCDGQINLDDLSVLLGGFGVDGRGDLTGDALTDLDDLILLLRNLGVVCP